MTESIITALQDEIKAAKKQKRITTIARPYSGGLDCEGDGSGPGCKNRAVWEIQAMQDDGSNYVYVCDDHLSDYQRWAVMMEVKEL